MRHLLHLLIAITALTAESLAAQSALHVPADHPTIQDAIFASTSGDVVLVAPGVYDEQIDFLGKAITVRSEQGAEVTTIDSQAEAIWEDQPARAVVRMVSGEGADTVLEGFTITGADDPSGASLGTSGVHCLGATPTLRYCIVRDNVAVNGAGVLGDAILESCQILDNLAVSSTAEGGGVWGAATIRNSSVRGNRSDYRGGGVYALAGCTITDTTIQGNRAGKSSTIGTGGGVYGPAVLRGCVLTGNRSRVPFPLAFGHVMGSAVEGAIELVRCTVADNDFPGDLPVGDKSGALHLVGSIVECIVWNNENKPISGVSSTTVEYSIVTGGAAGPGVLSADPLFFEPDEDNYALQPGSPAIDAGDPLSTPDPDGTVADLGALFFPQFVATFAVRNGNDVNPLSFATATTPMVGTTWTATIDAALHDPSMFAGALVGVFTPSAPLSSPFGELLIDPAAPPVLELASGVSAGASTLSVSIPADPNLIGLLVYTQGFAVGASVELTNAIDLQIGI